MFTITNPVTFFENLEKYGPYFKPLTNTSFPAPAGAIYASSTGNASTGSGTDASTPVSLQRALDLVAEDGTVVILGGTHRITTPLSIKKRCFIQGAQGTMPVLTGRVTIPVSSVLSHSTTGVYYFPHTTNLLDADPTEIVPADKPWLQYTNQLFINNAFLLPVGSIAALTPTTYFFDKAAGRMYFKQDPAGKNIEVIGTNSAFGNGGQIGGAATIRGLCIEKFSYGVYTYRPIKVEDCVIRLCSFIGGRVFGSTAGTHYKRNRIYKTGGTGIRGTQGIYEFNEISEYNLKGYRVDYGAAGIKLTGNPNVVGDYDTNLLPTRICSNYFHDTPTRSAWVDEGVKGAVISHNTFAGSSSFCAQSELCIGTILEYNLCNGFFMINNSKDNIIRKNTFYRPDDNAIKYVAATRVPDPTDTPIGGWDYSSTGHIVENNLFFAEDGRKRIEVTHTKGTHSTVNASAMFTRISKNVTAALTGMSKVLMKITDNSTATPATEYTTVASIKAEYPSLVIDWVVKEAAGTGDFFEADGVTPKSVLKNTDNTYPGAITPVVVTPQTCEEKLAIANTRNSALQAQLVEATTVREALELEISDKTVKISDLEFMLGSANEAVAAKNLEIASLTSQIQSITATIASKDATIVALNTRIDELEATPPADCGAVDTELARVQALLVSAEVELALQVDRVQYIESALTTFKQLLASIQ